MTHLRPPTISVVVPVYNAARTVLDSVSSVLDHTRAALELICVDDGSTDASAEILAALAASDDRVVLIRSACNQGPGAARNLGIDAASGDYVFFLDADDSVPPGALDALLAAARETGCELAIGNLSWLRRAEQATATPPLAGTGKVGTAHVFDSTWLQSVPGCHCCNLYRRQLLEKHGIRYPGDLSIGEDQLFQATAFVMAQTVATLDEVVYVYHHYRNESVTKKPATLRNLIDDVEYQSRLVRLYSKHGLWEAGLRFLRSSWSYSIENYWLQIPMVLAAGEAIHFFSVFRRMVAEFEVEPWTDSTPAHHRHVLGLILSGQDEQALAFLATPQAHSGMAAIPTVVAAH
jgi:glycosyltransferase involved in cell wall biosynthesis